MSGRRRAHAAGFTLIELMISLTVMTLALVGMLALYRTSSTSNSFARRYSTAHELAAGRIESMRPLPLATITAQAGTVAVIDEAGVSYRLVHEVDANVGGNPNLYRVRASASFGEDGDEADRRTAQLQVVRTVQEGL